MKRRQAIPGRYMPPLAIKGEKDSEIGRRIEKGQPADPIAQRQHLAKKMQDEDLKAKLVGLEQQDRTETEEEIKQLRSFLYEVADEERKRQAEMRERVEQIVEEKMSARPAQGSTRLPARQGFEAQGKDGLPELVEPSSKPKRGSFMARLKKKGKGAMAEARGAIAKGGG